MFLAASGWGRWKLKVQSLPRIALEGSKTSHRQLDVAGKRPALVDELPGTCSVSWEHLLCPIDMEPGLASGGSGLDHPPLKRPPKRQVPRYLVGGYICLTRRQLRIAKPGFRGPEGGSASQKNTGFPPEMVRSCHQSPRGPPTRLLMFHAPPKKGKHPGSQRCLNAFDALDIMFSNL